MNSSKAKLALAAVSLLAAFAVLASGTFAWFTLSADKVEQGITIYLKGEGDEWPFEFALSPTGEFTKDLRVFSNFAKNGDISGGARTVLRPITTSDGKNWYLPNYGYSGGVIGFRLAGSATGENGDFGTIGANLTNPSNNAIDSELDENSGLNYFVYFDIWVRTRDEKEAHELKISNPLATSTIFDYETHYGTYVVSLPVAQNDGSFAITEKGENASCCVRLGFLVYGEGEDGGDKFIIYEPNADKRSSRGAIEVGGQDIVYVSSDNQGGGTGVSTRASETEYKEGQVYDTLLPITQADGSIIINNSKQSDTIVQLKSSWNAASVAAISLPDFPDSRCLTTGQFTNTYTGRESLSGIDTIPITTVSYNDENGEKAAPKHIRVFMWLEGQDIDCWNVVEDGSIFANLEFRGDAVATPAE